MILYALNDISLVIMAATYIQSRICDTMGGPQMTRSDRRFNCIYPVLATDLSTNTLYVYCHSLLSALTKHPSAWRNM